MGFDFTPKNKKVGDFSLGAFTWPMMLDAGIGLPIRSGKGWKPAQFIWTEGKCAYANDGDSLTATEAKQMAQVAEWIADFQDAKRAVFEKDETKCRREEMAVDNERNLKTGRERVYQLPWAKVCTGQFRAFAKFARASGGFTIT